MTDYLPGMENAQRRRELSAWFTPPETARRIVEFCGPVQGLRVLEPSAGRGALAVPLRAAGADVVCVDIDPANMLELERLKFDIRCDDFLELHGHALGVPFDLAVMNPPFERNGAMRHMQHALKFAPRVVCHCPLSTLAGQERKAELWDRVYLQSLAICATRPKYSDEGGKTDMCTVLVLRGNSWGSAQTTQVEWWP
jgi:predicted RNA methylase